MVIDADKSNSSFNSSLGARQLREFRQDRKSMQASRVHLIDAVSTLSGISRELRSNGYIYHTHQSVEDFITHARSNSSACVIIDVSLLGSNIGGPKTQVKQLGNVAQTIVVADHLTVSVAVELMEHGAATVLIRPLDFVRLRQAIERVMSRTGQPDSEEESRRDFTQRWESLSDEEQEIAELMLSGKKNKAIAGTIKLSNRTIDRRRQSIFKKMNVSSLSELGLLYGRFRSGD